MRSAVVGLKYIGYLASKMLGDFVYGGVDLGSLWGWWERERGH